LKFDRRTSTCVLVTTPDREKRLTDYLDLTRRLRSEGVPTEIFLDAAPLREQIGYASNKGIRFAVIATSKELNRGVVNLKDLVARRQEEVRIENLTEEIEIHLPVAWAVGRSKRWH